MPNFAACGSELNKSVITALSMVGSKSRNPFSSLRRILSSLLLLLPRCLGTNGHHLVLCALLALNSDRALPRGNWLPGKHRLVRKGKGYDLGALRWGPFCISTQITSVMHGPALGTVESICKQRGKQSYLQSPHFKITTVGTSVCISQALF